MNNYLKRKKGRFAYCTFLFLISLATFSLINKNVTPDKRMNKELIVLFSDVSKITLINKSNAQYTKVE